MAKSALLVGDFSQSEAAMARLLRKPRPVAGCPFSIFLLLIGAGTRAPHGSEQTQSRMPGKGDLKPAFLPQDAHWSNPGELTGTTAVAATGLAFIAPIFSGFVLHTDWVDVRQSLQCGASGTNLYPKKISTFFGQLLWLQAIFAPSQVPCSASIVHEL